jgi:hypothetical protein
VRTAAAIVALAAVLVAFLYVGIYQFVLAPGNTPIVFRLNRWTGEVCVIVVSTKLQCSQ